MFAHAQRFAHELAARGLVSDRKVLSLASHGGHLAPFIREHGVAVSIMERHAAHAARLEATGETVIRVDIDDPTTGPLAGTGTFDLVVDAYLLGHLEHPRDALGRLVALLAPGGSLVVEFDDLLATVAGGQWDAIGHGHPTYLSLGWVVSELEHLGLGIVDAEPQPVYGGAMRIYAQAARSRGASLSTLLAREAAAGIGRPQGLAPLADALARACRDVVPHLRAARDAGRPVVGYGAPGRSITFLNALGIGPDLLPYVVDRAPSKQGRLIPGVEIPIRPIEALAADRPDEVLILTWNLAAEVVAALRPVLPRTRFWVAIPELEDVTERSGPAPG